MTAPSPILELVARFDRNVDAYRSGSYNETQLRREFVDPLFAALGWDVHNLQGWAEAYKEVIHEDAVRIGGTIKAPDYAFRIGGVRKFFVETKKPSVFIKEEIPPAFQLRRYAWSAKLPLSILTDFEEFAVYDTRIKPEKADRASKARTLYLRYTEYAERWEEIAGVFGRDAILQGSFDRYAESNRRKRGTADVDDAFLEEIEGWRELLARNLALRNPALSQRQLNFAVQRTLDRIIFLRIAEDPGIEEYGRLLALTNGSNVYARLRVLFERADERYNSGLFHFRQERGRDEAPDELTPGLTLDDAPLKQIFRSLYYPESPYEFSVLPADILGQVYERFLGKVIRLTAGHRAVVEEKPEVRKAGGVYYTPTYIVDYIVRNTVGMLVEGFQPGPRGGVSKLRILDPACGSGSFLLGAYQFLLDWHRERYAEEPERWREVLVEAPGGGWRLTTTERKRILLNNIYGVDIDPQAVEVTKLSLLLKVLEGENAQTLTRQMALFHQRALPDLSENIKSGNSLIGPDFYDGKQLGLLDEEEQWRVNAFDWDAEFPEIMKGGGFDAVIGNPPYVLLATTPEKGYLKQRYPLSTGKPDLYRYFIQRSHELLKSGGHFGFIVPKSVLTIPAAEKLRRYLLNEGGITQIVNFRGEVFRGVSVNSVILLSQKKTPRDAVQVMEDVSRHPTVATLAAAVQVMQEVPKAFWRTNVSAEFFIGASEEGGQIIRKLRETGVALSTVADYTLGMQVYHHTLHSRAEIKERAFHAPMKPDETYWPESGGRNVKRYQFSENFTNFVAYGEWCYNKPDWAFCSEPRIVIREIPGKDTLECAFTNSVHVPTKALVIVIPRTVNVHYLLGILNSRLIGYYVQQASEKGSQRLFPRISLTTVRQLPVRSIDFSDLADAARHDRMVSLVEQMLALHEQLASTSTAHDKTLIERQIRTTDRQIDRLVYELYGLTEEEIGIVEGASGK